jgi:rhodanese-related sulfurtransferase
VEFLQQNLNMIWALLATASGAWLLVDFIRQQGDKTLVSPLSAILLINREDAVVVDVRPQGEFDQGHLPNARHLPFAEFERRSGELDKFRERPLILYCANGSRAAAAVATLKKSGFTRLYNLRGGFFEWEKASQPISRKRK